MTLSFVVLSQDDSEPSVTMEGLSLSGRMHEGCHCVPTRPGASAETRQAHEPRPRWLPGQGHGRDTDITREVEGTRTQS